MKPARRSGPAELLELDLLRGFAAVLMIVNHAGFSLLDPQLLTAGPASALVFAGGFAPAVFFFATGFGVAVSSRASGSAPRMSAVLPKAALLLAADQFLFWRVGDPFGLNFLGFIALASVLCSWVAGLRGRFAVACVAVGAIAVLRYGIGPLFSMAPHAPWLDWLIGRGVAAIGYPFSPWMALPMLGLAVGLRYPIHAAPEPVLKRWHRWSLAVAVLFLCLSVGANALGASFFRWGTMGLGFFVLCFGVIAALGWLSTLMAGALPSTAGWLGLRGVASFAVVPVHYVVVDLAVGLFGARLSQGEFVVVAIVIVAISCALAKLVANGIQRLVRSGQAPLAIGLSGVALACALGLLFASLHDLAGRMALMAVGQLAIAGLLAFRTIRRSGPAIRRALS